MMRWAALVVVLVGALLAVWLGAHSPSVVASPALQRSHDVGSTEPWYCALPTGYFYPECTPYFGSIPTSTPQDFPPGQCTIENYGEDCVPYTPTVTETAVPATPTAGGPLHRVCGLLYDCDIEAPGAFWHSNGGSPYVCSNYASPPVTFDSDPTHLLGVQCFGQMVQDFTVPAPMTNLCLQFDYHSGGGYIPFSAQIRDPGGSFVDAFVPGQTFNYYSYQNYCDTSRIFYPGVTYRFLMGGWAAYLYIISFQGDLVPVDTPTQVPSDTPAPSSTPAVVTDTPFTTSTPGPSSTPQSTEVICWDCRDTATAAPSGTPVPSSTSSPVPSGSPTDTPSASPSPSPTSTPGGSSCDGVLCSCIIEAANIVATSIDALNNTESQIKDEIGQEEIDIQSLPSSIINKFGDLLIQLFVPKDPGGDFAPTAQLAETKYNLRLVNLQLSASASCQPIPIKFPIPSSHVPDTDLNLCGGELAPWVRLFRALQLTALYVWSLWWTVDRIIGLFRGEPS